MIYSKPIPAAAITAITTPALRPVVVPPVHMPNLKSESVPVLAQAPGQTPVPEAKDVAPEQEQVAISQPIVSAHQGEVVAPAEVAEVKQE